MTKQELLSISQNPILLDEHINNSNGYILYQIHFEDINIPIESLIKNNKINTLSLNFILQNYTLSDEHKKIARQYLHFDSKELIADDIITPTEIEDYLKAKIEPPKNAILSISMLLKYQKQIEEIHSDYPQTINNIIAKSLLNKDISDILKLGQDFIYLYTDAFNSKDLRYLFNNQSFSTVFKDRHINGKDTDSCRNTQDFKNFNFNNHPNSATELMDVIKIRHPHTWAREYSFYASYSGFHNQISKLDYLKKYNSSLEEWSNQEISDNISTIRDVIFEHLKNNRYNTIENIYRIKAPIESFKKIFNDSFLNKIFNTIPDINIAQYADRDNKDFIEKRTHYQQSLLRFIINNPQIIHSKEGLEIDLEDVIEVLKNLAEREYSKEEARKTEQTIKTFLANILPSFLQTEKITHLIRRNKDYLFTHDNRRFIQPHVFQQQPSINHLLLLLSTREKYLKKENNNLNDSIKETELNKEINKIIPFLLENDVKKLFSLYPYDYKGKYRTEENKTNNIFAYDSYDYHSIDNHMKFLILSADSDYFHWIIKNKHKIESELLYTAISDNETPQLLLDNLATYFKENRQEVEQTPYFKNIKSHQYAYKILGDYTDNDQEKKWLEVLDIIKNTSNKYNDVWQETHTLVPEIQHATVVQGLDLLLSNKDYQSIFHIIRLFNHTEHIIKVITHLNQLNYAKIIPLIDNPNFIQLIKSFSSSDNKQKIELNFTQSECHTIATKLLPHFKTDNKYDIFRLFSAQTYDFIKPFAIKNFKKDIFYHHYLSPGESYNLKKQYITSPYSNEDVLKIYDNLQKNNNLFNTKDTNAKIADFFQDNFKNREQEYLQLLNTAKTTRPLLYVLLLNPNILEDFSENYCKTLHTKNPENLPLNREERANLYFNHLYNKETIINAIPVIMESIKNAIYDRPSKVNTKLLKNIIPHFLYLTSYSSHDSNGSYSSKTHTNQKDSEDILKALFIQSPLFLMSINTIGAINNTSSFIKHNFGQLAEYYIANKGSIAELVNDILIPNFNHKAEGFTTTGRYQEYIQNNLEGLINYCAKSNQLEHINYISFLYESYQFQTHNLKYSRLSQRIINTDILDVLENSPDLLNKIASFSTKYEINQIMINAQQKHKPLTPKKQRL